MLPIVMTLIWGYFWFIAGSLFVGRRPLLLSTKWFFVMMAIAFVPSIVAPFFLTPNPRLGFLVWANPFLLTLVLAYLWLQMKGWYAFGVTRSYLREAITVAAAQQGWTVEEYPSAIHIRETDDEVKIAVHGWTGTAQFRVVGKPATGRVIARGVRAYYAANPGQLNASTVYFYLIAGGVIGLCGVAIPIVLNF